MVHNGAAAGRQAFWLSLTRSPAIPDLGLVPFNHHEGPTLAFNYSLSKFERADVHFYN